MSGTRVIADAGGLRQYVAALAAGTGPIAVDAERASGFRYSQRAYLVQIRRHGAGTALIDPIPLANLTSLASAMAGQEWVLHAATQDLPCLAELGLRPTMVFDTELAGRLLGRERVGLAALVASELGHHLAKGHGAADWSKRPLDEAMLRYAELDVEYLVELRDALAGELIAAGKADIAEQEFTRLLSFEPKPPGAEPWRRTSGLHRVRHPARLAVARELWWARDEVARTSDIASGRILPDSAIVAAALSDATTATELAATEGFHGRGAGRHLSTWWSAVERGRSTTDPPSTQVTPAGLPHPRTWAERNPPAHERYLAARELVAELSEEQAIPAENLLSPDLLRQVSWSDPDDLAAALVSGGARPWQVELFGPRLRTRWSAVAR